MKEPAAIIWHGVGGRRVARAIRNDLHVVFFGRGGGGGCHISVAYGGFFIPTFPEKVGIKIKPSHLWPYIPNSFLSFVALLFSSANECKALWSSGYILTKCLAVKGTMLCYVVLSSARCRYVVVCFCFALRYANVLFCLVHGSLLRSLTQPLQHRFCYLPYGSFTVIYKRQVLLDKTLK